MSDKKYTVGKIEFSPYKSEKLTPLSKEQVSAEFFAARTPDEMAKSYIDLKSQLNQSQLDLEQANKDRLPENWGLRRHVKGEIVVSHKDGSGVLIREDADKISESLFYRMMSQILDGGGTNTSEALEKANKDIQVLAEALSEAVIVLKEVRSIHGLKSDLPDAFELIANKYKDKT